ncbi:hypothetical protein FSO04_05265 [Paraburkholderia madseniana]|uniref:Uncharacterized protein n=1 Tax=Paraburkholderia madseniana TaxID=2599607 RepID=A0A6N6WMD1_9BURK|nr:hypothetical protein [Paraburkholderia madseniana]KAE8761128.1 hypothetical protein FSO04_05265 [Paraburkholderia madseniana]
MNLKHQNQQTTQRQATTQLSTRAPTAKGFYVFHRADDQFGSAVTYSWFRNRTTKVAERTTESFQELAMRCRTPEIRAKNDGATFSPFTFRHRHFHEYDARECSFLAFKFEKVRGCTQAEDILACVGGLASFLYSTHNHSVSEQPTGSYQLIVALRTPVPKQYFKVVAMNFATRFCRLSGIIHPAYASWDQRIQFPSCPSSLVGEFVAKSQGGRAHDWLPDFLERQAPKSSESWGMQ